MPRPKTQSDEDVLEAAHRLIHAHGPEALTFERLSEACGLSGSTLVQRFKSKAALKQRTLLQAWDRLDGKTERLAAAAPRSPAGAIGLLVALSRDYGGIESYAEGLLVLREDLRDPLLRARGASWKASLGDVLDACFASTGSAPPDIGLLMASHWQGSLLWWSFDPTIEVAAYVEESLNRFVTAISARNP
ncbi:helix-turn-helix domain-containing protein [Mesorhizobium sp.]|uniref:TetR/AcrR family transcriptional regulator n=1 Tax=Mesorhizobium sp. TaxID=1871066 RepID=UPI000FE9897E|nr:helix-turn-helix domain-containing protein [Mesorhizobium sp.]RWE66255.1 MAG: TetR/AcrR family transcriptional regulator [Mesorhizobium sp.]RWE95045.1 MAG: TetR/AcrR family transcriptional regulator [Mesorhizobium sp.]TIU23346.1 MAG: TetR/AcrR family transcriptional regulator [Mesorhizobium sp.]TIV09725.1 MAG: TetR/AcrR family transcriptional regulator [Mesorhizobium sp.]TIX02172.1 MAG: TetR/AcrR family transcriptional regulator [Mesorhizobium sp.]